VVDCQFSFKKTWCICH